MPLGSHDMFLAEVVAVQVDAAYIDPVTGRFCLERACPIVYSHGEYFALGEAIGHFGWSVRKKPRRTVALPPQSPHLPAGEYPGCGSFRSSRGRPRGREARRKTCSCAKPPAAPAARRSRRKPDAKKPRRPMPGAGLSGDAGAKQIGSSRSAAGDAV